MLSRPKLVEICDELESFFYVILYYAVRYLRSNIDDADVRHWIHSFFDTYGVHRDTYVCGEKKLNAIKNGELLISPTEKLKFHSPMDDVIAELLMWFKAHHAVTMYDLKDEKLQVIPEASRDASSSNSVVSYRARRSRPTPKSQALEKIRSKLKVPAQHEQPPSKTDEELHVLVGTHTAMQQLLGEAIDPVRPGSSAWKTNDKIGEHVPKDYRPPHQEFGPTLPGSLACIKKAKLDEQGMAMAVSAPSYLQSREPKTPQRKQPVGIPGHATLQRQ